MQVFSLPINVVLRLNERLLAAAAEGNPCPGSLLKVAWIEIRPPALIPAASNAIETRPRPAGDPRIWTVVSAKILLRNACYISLTIYSLEQRGAARGYAKPQGRNVL